MLEQLVELVKPEGLAGDYLIEFLQDDLPHGLADPHLRLVRVYLGGEQDLQRGLAFTWRNRITARTMAEAAVYVTAHELRHLYQAEAGMRLRNEPKERDADAYAARCLRRWRRLSRAGAGPGPTITTARALRLTHQDRLGVATGRLNVGRAEGFAVQQAVFPL